jgi:hypothetical protein
MVGFGYHCCMRRCLYILLILMLPLRGWMGDAMAMQMAFPASAPHAVMAGGQAQSKLAGEQAHVHHVSTVMQMGFDVCGGHGAADDPGNRDETSHCGECALCQTCHTVAVLRVADISDAGLQRPAVPRLAAPGFTSADRALVLKPPTS